MLFRLLIVALVAGPLTATAETSGLFVKTEDKIINVQDLIDKEVDVYSEYEFNKFCFKGSSEAVVKLMNDWSKNTDYFFSGGGGGYILRSLDVIPGPKINMKLEDEVVPGEFKTITIETCD